MDIHAGVMQHQVLEADELADEPQAGAGVLEMGPAINPAAIGLDLMRSSRRASASSAAASTPKAAPVRGHPRRRGKGWRGSRKQRGDVDRDAWDEVRREGSAGPALRQRIYALLRLAIDLDGGSRDVDDPDFGDAEARVEGGLAPRS